MSNREEPQIPTWDDIDSSGHITSPLSPPTHTSSEPDNSTDINSHNDIQAASVNGNNPGGDTSSSDSGSSAERASKASNDNGKINNSSLASNPDPSSDDSSNPTESPLAVIDPASSASAFPTSDPSNDSFDASSTSDGVPASTDTADASVSSSSSAEISGDGGMSGGMSANTKVAIAVPVAVGGALLIAAIIFLVFFLRRRKQLQQHQQPQQQQQQKGNGQIPTQAPAQERGLDQPPPYGPEDSRVEMASATAPVAGWSGSPRFPFDEPTQATVDAGPESDAHRGIGVAVTPEQQQQQTQPDVAATAKGFHDINNDLNRSRTQSPFDDPDDALSEISRGVGGTGSVRSAVSAVSDEGDRHAYGHGQGHGGLGYRLD